MLSVLLKILAVLGILLLVILAIILFVLLIVLFVPITYRLCGEINDVHKKANVKVNWLFGILRFNLYYSENLTWKIKVLWFDLTGIAKKNSRDSGETTPHAETAAPHAEEPKQSEEVSLPSEDETASSETEPVKKSLSEKINDLILKLQTTFTKVKEIWANITHYLNVLQEEDTKDLILHCFGVTGKILKSIKPRKLAVDAVIGFDSPDTTGKIYGFLCMLYPYYGNDIHITPDFENKVLEVNLFSRGRIFICVLVWNALMILLDRKLFKVIHKFKNGGKRKNGR